MFTDLVHVNVENMSRVPQPPAGHISWAGDTAGARWDTAQPANNYNSGTAPRSAWPWPWCCPVGR